MTEAEELNMVSESLIRFWALHGKEFNGQNTAEIYNAWSRKTEIRINYENTLRWALSFLTDNAAKPMPEHIDLVPELLDEISRSAK